MTVLATTPTSAYTERAIRIAERLCDDALDFDDRCTWIGARQDGYDAIARFTHAPIDADLYSGTSGVALFLAEAFARTKDDRFRRIAAGAALQAIACVERIPRAFRVGLYSGDLGVAYTLVRIGLILDREDFCTTARQLLLRLVEEDSPFVLDVMSGAAGAVTPLLALSRQLGEPRLEDYAHHLGERIIEGAIRTDAGWSWDERATGFGTAAHLTGHAHGAGGMGWALLELYARFGDASFRDGAREAFRFENSKFVADVDNWPDFRYSDGVSTSTGCGLAWCLGAPGIGMNRIRAHEIDPDPVYRADIAAAWRTVAKAFDAAGDVAVQDFSLCHGWPGIAEFLLMLAAEGNSQAEDMARRIADAAVDRHEGERSWCCGMARHTTPTLMLGLAGIGYFYLRMADRSLPSVLMVAPSPAVSA